MKSKLFLKISAIDYYTMSKISFKENIVCDGLNFIDKQTEPFDINGGKKIMPSYTITAKQQADEWVSNQSDFLKNLISNPKRELNCILNWEVIKIENEDEKGVKSFPIAIHKKENKQNKLSELEIIKLVFIKLGELKNDSFDDDFITNFIQTHDREFYIPDYVLWSEERQSFFENMQKSFESIIDKINTFKKGLSEETINEMISTTNILLSN